MSHRRSINVALSVCTFTAPGEAAQKCADTSRVMALTAWNSVFFREFAEQDGRSGPWNTRRHVFVIGDHA